MTENELAIIFNCILKPEYKEQREILRAQIKKNYIYKIRRVSSQLLSNIKSEQLNHKETINLLFQAKYTIKNVHTMLRRKQFIDANALLRSAFENIAMAMAIDCDKNTYNEFKDLSIDEFTRCYTRPCNTIDMFRRIFINLDNELTSDISNTRSKKLFEDFYDRLCKFTHSTMLVNYIIEFQKKESIDMFISLFKINVYFLETVIYLCAKKISGNKRSYINSINIVIGYYILLYDITSSKIEPEIIEKYKELFHFDENVDYIKKETKKLNDLLN